MVPNLWVNLQFTHFCRDAGNVAIYALWEPKKNMNPGFRAKITEIPALPGKHKRLGQPCSTLFIWGCYETWRLEYV